MDKQAKTKIILSAVLALIVLTASFYMFMPGKLRIDFEKTRTIFKIYEDDKFVTSGIEYTRIFDGTRLMRAKNRSISYIIKDSTTEWYRVAMFKEGIIAEDFVGFENEATNINYSFDLFCCCWSFITGLCGAICNNKGEGFADY